MTEETNRHGIPKLSDGIITEISGSRQSPSILVTLENEIKVAISVYHTSILYQATDLGIEISAKFFDSHINRGLLRKINQGQAASVLRWFDCYLERHPDETDHADRTALTRACVEISTFTGRSVVAIAGNRVQRSFMQFCDRDTPEKSLPLMAIAHWMNWRAGVITTATTRALQQPTTHGFAFQKRPPATSDHIWVALAGKQDPRRQLHAGSTAHEQMAAHRHWRDEIVPKGHGVRAEIAKHSHFSSRQLEAMMQALGSGR